MADSYWSKRCQRCSNPAVKDGYCRVHHPDLLKQRKAQSHFRRERAQADRMIYVAEGTVVYIGDNIHIRIGRQNSSLRIGAKVRIMKEVW